MASVSVLNCFEVLVNGIAVLVESNLTIFDLTWNCEFTKCVIFDTEQVEWNMVILGKVWDHLSTINSIFSNFCMFGILVSIKYYQYNWYSCQSNIIFLIKFQCITLILIHAIRMISLISYYIAYVSYQKDMIFYYHTGK